MLRIVLSFPFGEHQTRGQLQREIQSVLTALGWAGNVGSLLLDWLTPQDINMVMLSVDVKADGGGAWIESKIGVELQTRDIGTALSSLVDRKLCSRERESAVVTYLGLPPGGSLPLSGQSRHAFDAETNMTTAHGFSHLKIVMNEKRVLEAKVYLVVGACGGRGDLRRRCTVPCAEVFEAAAAAAAAAA